MGTYITDVITPEELTGYVRESQVLQGPTLESVLPPREVSDIEFELTNIDSPLIQVARYRAWDTAPPVGKRPGFAVIRGEIGPMGLSLTLNEKELARLTKLREKASDGSNQDIYDDALQTALACQVRYEQARADLLLDGKVTIDENGFKTEADFSVPGAHIVTAATLWSDTANATPIINLKAWEATYRSNNGGANPDGWLVSSDIVGELAVNAQVKSLANEGGGVPGIVPEGRIGTVLRVAGVKAPLVVFDGQIPDANGVVGPTLPVRKVIAFRRGMGETFFGTTPSAELLIARGLIKRREAPGIVSFAVEDILPARVTTTSEAVGLPVLRDPKALFVATV